MIYCSTACIKEKNLILNIKRLSDLGFQNIELTGGCDYLSSIEGKLLNLKREYEINFLIHNYFPPPSKEFVINTSDKEIQPNLKNYFKKSLDLCKLLNSPYFSIHAGFLISINSFNSIRNAKNISFLSESLAIQNMKSIYNYLEKISNNEIKIYIENNVIGNKNFKLFGNKNPFLLTCLDDYKKIKKIFNFNFLLDLAHLKVSCKTMGLNFLKQANYLINHSDYIHLSGNNDIEDTNISLLHDKVLINFLKNSNDLTKKKFTLEVYSGDRDLRQSFDYLNSITKFKNK